MSQLVWHFSATVPTPFGCQAQFQPMGRHANGFEGKIGGVDIPEL
jgi:hypothetical protein